MSDAVVAPSVPLPAFAESAVNLADGSLGAEIVAASDAFFAPAPRMLNPDQPVFHPTRYDDHGKWMDGWETRRRRGPGHDWCVVRLALPGVIQGVDFDTSFFTGNFPPAASLEACYSPGADPRDDTEWTQLVAPTSLAGDTHHFLPVGEPRHWTHVRVSLFPDGGIARLRVYGQPWCDWASRPAGDEYDLLALVNGGRQVGCSDAHYGQPRNLLRPGRGVNMGDGWETRRRREPGNDWCILQLGHPGTVRRVEVDTAHFKGNFPDRCSIQAALVTAATDRSLVPQSMFWETLLPEQKLQADAVHAFTEQLNAIGPISHVRFNIIPDGGVSRLRLFGYVAR